MRGHGSNGFISKLKKDMLKIPKKSLEPFGSCRLNSTANLAQFGWKWARLAVIFSRQVQKTIEIHALPPSHFDTF